MGIISEQGIGRQQHAWGTKPTLDSSCVGKRFLQWMELLCRPQGFSRHECTTTCLGGQHHTAWTWHTIDEHSASTTFASLTAVLDTDISSVTEHCQQRFIGSSTQARDDAVETQLKFPVSCRSFGRNQAMPARGV